MNVAHQGNNHDLYMDARVLAEIQNEYFLPALIKKVDNAKITAKKLNSLNIDKEDPL